ncbi:hypothetical protein [Nocardioides cynanchi]|uniref:hypothetical protein n=1 Tax=Nocardioides cynanchi TaxID=2558918 RepID=UPI001244CE35|nr:hypothetical protein [Nocardioides cynanchi]
MSSTPIVVNEALPESGEAWRDAAEVGIEESRDAWAEAARPILIEVARHYQQVITYKDLATQAQRVTGVRSTQQMHYWIGDVLKRVSTDSFGRGEPLLSALCVSSDGSVGERYAAAVAATTGDLTDDSAGDGDDHAALQRLACYRHFKAADLPADGGSPALTPQLTARRARAKKVRLAEAPIDVCPKCHTQLPATKVCDNYCT